MNNKGITVVDKPI